MVLVRNVDFDESQPVERWSYEALVTHLERGSISDWARITAAIKVDPWGPVARQIEDYLSYSRPYGLAGLLERAITRARSARDGADRSAVTEQVQGLIEQSGLPMEEFASRIGTSRSRLSTYRSGTVVPSAALIWRMQWLADRAAHGESRAHTAS